MSVPKRIGLVLVLLAPLAACRDGSESSGTGGVGFDVDPIPPSLIGADGCNGPDHVFAGPFPIAPVAVWSSGQIASTSRMTAAQGSEEIYITLADGAIVALDFSGGDPPAETEVLSPGFITSTVLGSIGPAVISGIALTTEDFLVVMEHTGNVLVSVRREPMLATAYGTPSEMGGLIDGQLFSARFLFEEPGDLCSTEDGRIYVPDTGNHVLRVVEPTSEGIFVDTVAGTGQTVSEDGDILATSFDTPAGLKVSCFNELIVTERGNFGGGNRLRAVLFGTDPFFGGPALESVTLAGSGDPFTEAGVGEEASLAGPSAAVATSEDEVYWVDTLTGVLRRFDFNTDLADCPLDVDCAAAQLSTPFTAGGDFSLTISDAGDLYVLDTTAQTLYRIP